MTVETRRSPLRRLVSRGGALLVTGVTLYLLAPSLLEVFSSWDQVSQLELRWMVAVGLAQVLAWVCVQALQRLVLGTRRWFPIITSQLAGSAAARLVPGGGAAGLAVQYQMLRTAGVETAGVGLGLGSVSLLQLAITAALPILVIPTLLVDPPSEPRLTSLAVSAVLFFILLTVVFVVFFTRDRPLLLLGRAVDRVRRALGRPAPDLPTGDRVISQRDVLAADFEPHWQKATALAIGRATMDFLSLMVAIAAFGVTPRPSLVLLAYASASLLAMIPITPGGLGFVEAGLTGLLVLAGIPAVESVSITFLYRLFSFWLPIPVGLAAGVVHRARYRSG